MTVFEYVSYKAFYLDYLKTLPKKGHGQFRKLAHHLNLSPVVITQVFKGDRQLNMEQAFDACSYFGFNKLETRYFLLLVQKERAGSHRLRKELEEQIQEHQKKAQDLKHRIPKVEQLSEESKSVYYSQWYYSGIRLLCDLGEGVSEEELSERLNLPLSRVREVVDFLVRNSLCTEQSGLFKRTPMSTHLGSQHPLISRHHQNWRFKGVQHMEPVDDEDLFFTGPMVLSEKAIDQIRKELVNTISRITKITEGSKSETLACLNIDWFRF